MNKNSPWTTDAMMKMQFSYLRKYPKDPYTMVQEYVMNNGISFENEDDIITVEELIENDEPSNVIEKQFKERCLSYIDKAFDKYYGETENVEDIPEQDDMPEPKEEKDKLPIIYPIRDKIGTLFINIGTKIKPLDA